MSAPNQGRQSPEPETQTGAQQQDPMTQGKAGAAKENFSKDQSEDTKSGLESNPTHPLQQAADDKISKTVS